MVDPSAIGIPADSPYKTMKDMVDAGKAKLETIKFGSNGPMTEDHLGIVLLEKASGAKFATVGFDGAASNTSARITVVPAGSPKVVVDALSKAMKSAWDVAEHQERMQDAGLTLRWMTAPRPRPTLMRGTS